MQVMSLIMKIMAGTAWGLDITNRPVTFMSLFTHIYFLLNDLAVMLLLTLLMCSRVFKKLYLFFLLKIVHTK